jgi:hypothetical protein
MTTDDIIRLAREAGWNWPEVHTTSIEDRLERFAALVAAAEREACAKVCEQRDEDGEGPDCWGWHSKDYAAAIRARSKE